MAELGFVGKFPPVLEGLHKPYSHTLCLESNSHSHQLDLTVNQLNLGVVTIELWVCTYNHQQRASPKCLLVYGACDAQPCQFDRV